MTGKPLNMPHTRFRWLSERLPRSDQRRLAVITGARQTGKTTLARELFPELRYINLDDADARAALRSVRTTAPVRSASLICWSKPQAD